MKSYRVVQVTSAEAFETSLNDLAQLGWTVVAANMAYQGDARQMATYFALLESAPLEPELKQMLETRTDELDDIDLSPSAN
ncbi:hypothetical protein [Botryobacter ruber]|uniref:hypothetical protein n=1 Tax=Botryobacter ruber TaxID=2171629 RepID=UPI000E09F0F1|nr:hypothetical protein [Botryobacter ruber]